MNIPCSISLAYNNNNNNNNNNNKSLFVQIFKYIKIIEKFPHEMYATHPDISIH